MYDLIRPDRNWSLYNWRRDDPKVFFSDCWYTIRDNLFKAASKKNTIAAACHIHSDWSYDGKWPLPKLAAEFQPGAT
jgi:hypothetical protein